MSFQKQEKKQFVPEKHLFEHISELSLGNHNSSPKVELSAAPYDWLNLNPFFKTRTEW